jgi:hypothetical protein
LRGRACDEAEAIGSVELADKRTKKRGVPRIHFENDAWELLPQICVVSVNESAEIAGL